MKPAEEILRLSKEADAALLKSDSRGIPDIEAHCLAIVRIAREHPEKRGEVCGAFRQILTERSAGAWEVLMLVMHLLRWPEMKDWLEKKKSEAVATNDWRGEPVYRHILDAFADDWADRDMYDTFTKRA